MCTELELEFGSEGIVGVVSFGFLVFEIEIETVLFLIDYSCMSFAAS